MANELDSKFKLFKMGDSLRFKIQISHCHLFGHAAKSVKEAPLPMSLEVIGESNGEETLSSIAFGKRSPFKGLPSR